jgi:hypothetical protein
LIASSPKAAPLSTLLDTLIVLRAYPQSFAAYESHDHFVLNPLNML